MKIIKHLRLRADEKRLIEMRRDHKPKKCDQKGKVFLLEAETALPPRRLIHLAGLTDSLREVRKMQPIGFVFGSNLKKRRPAIYDAISSRILWKLQISRPQRLLRSFGVQTILLTKKTRRQKSEAKGRLTELLARADKKSDVLAWCQGGVQFGDLLYAHYLRAEKLGTVTLSSPGFQAFAHQFLTALLFWIEEFDRLEPAGVAVMNTEYGPGVLLRIAAAKGVPALRVWPEGFSAVTDGDSNPHRLQFQSLRRDFEMAGSTVIRQNLSVGSTLFESRQRGEIDQLISYLPVSQLIGGEDNVQIEDPNILNVLVAPHCFWEAVNVFGTGLFADYWEWLCFIGDMSETSQVQFYLKAHPNFDSVDNDIVQEFLRLYPKVKKINGHVGHHALVQQGIKLVLTDHGTIATEYPALGVPVLTATQWAPYRDWGFAIAPKSVQEMRDLILAPPEISARDAKQEIVHYFAAVKWRSCSQSLFFFPKKDLDTHLEDQRSLLDHYLELHTGEDHQLVKSKVEDLFSFLDENPRVAVYQTSKSRHLFD